MLSRCIFIQRVIFLGIVISLYSESTLAGTSIKPLAQLVDKATQGKYRDQGNNARDQYRHPKETLQFFGLQPHMHVVEIWPSKGWYTEILAPVLRDTGKLYAAGFSISAKRSPNWRKQMQRDFQEKLAAHPDVFDQVVLTELSIPEQIDIAPRGSVDMVLTFRNVHNWMKGDYAQDVFEAMFHALKPGGILGVVEHRANPEASVKEMIESGYVSESYVIDLARKSGFTLCERSEINANSLDTKNYPKGVWTLPPVLRLGEEVSQKYLTIGESDRMTLKFIKPE